MKISVVTVSYNSASTIGDTLASVAAQTHHDVEHLVIDGASTDDTSDIVRRQGTTSTHLVSEPDKGIYDAMNKGLRMATGDYVGFLNADDMFATPQVLSQIAAAARDGADAVYGNLVYVRQHQVEHVVRRWHSGEFSASRLRFGWMPPHPTFYLKRSVWQQIGGFDTTLKVAADYDLMLRCLVRSGARAAYVAEVLVRMRLGGLSNASTRSMLLKSQEDLKVIRRHRLGGWTTLLAKNLRKLPQFF